MHSTQPATQRCAEGVRRPPSNTLIKIVEKQDAVMLRLRPPLEYREITTAIVRTPEMHSYSMSCDSDIVNPCGAA